jgi:subtilisin
MSDYPGLSGQTKKFWGVMLLKKFFLVILCALILAVPAAGYADTGDGGNRIVVFKAGAGPDLREKAIKDAGGMLVKHLELVDGTAVKLPAGVEQRLKDNPLVEGVYPDLRVSERVDFKKAASTQEIPWGITRIGADKAWSRSTGNGVRVAVIDSGIDLDHPDLAANIRGGFNAVNHKDSYNDGFGHGTHVSGIIAALNNTFGVVGTSYNAGLYAVKVLDDSGSGLLSDVIEGLHWAVKNHMQVANISLEIGQDSPPFHKAIARAVEAGVVVVAAAGNDGAATAYPAAYPEVIAVSAVDKDGNVAPWSNTGKIELAAPGVDVLSTIPGGLIPGALYYLSSGTSMASPHVAGTVALLMATPPGRYDANHNGVWDPAEVKMKLRDSAEILPGLTAAQQGWGLVRADRAVSKNPL